MPFVLIFTFLFFVAFKETNTALLVSATIMAFVAATMVRLAITRPPLTSHSIGGKEG